MDSVDDLVRKWAARTPDAVAVIGPDGALTYAELVDRADALAERLRRAGAAPETPVLLCLPRSAALVIGALGVLTAGAPYAPVDPAHPVLRLRSTVADSGATILVRAPGGLRAPAGVTEIDLTADQFVHSGLSSAVRHHENSLAYVIHTSGSSGRPKSVQVDHAGLRHLVDWHHRAFALSSADRVAQIAGPGFDAAVWETWAALTAGASLHVPDEETRLSPTALRDWLSREGITTAFAPTALAESLMALDWPADTPLRTLLTGGEALLRRPPPGLPFAVVNNYGLTEAVVVSTTGHVRPGVGTPTIGTPVDHADVHIVDEDLHPVPGGTAGELLLGGPALARGYAGQPALTASRFVPDHLGGRPGTRLLRTGDRVRRGPDGELEFLGRVDDQISLNGYRIEPAEVAAALTAHPAVRSAVVVPEPGRPTTPRLIAYLVSEGDPPGEEELVAFVADRLPAPMVPGGYVWLTEFPLSPNGKVNRAELPPAPAPGRNPGLGGELEATLVPMVADVLQLPTVAVDEDFFRLGGHSLLGAQLVMRLQERFGVDMTLRFLFAHPTVSRMAAGIEAMLLDEVEALSEDEAAGSDRP
ncbi:non-ribosomal peptide synthetase [Saccharothrix deserti]|uniref:non-ribosomal peptide synthetase n=1 Tax=Saccharothrix deserti TaxID=2593674 RepID=UPI00131D37DD|nr:non-ribosomal peptide synthetase [Saccharothrix deserti]